MYRLLRPLLFRLDPEFAHALTIQLLRLAGASSGVAGLIRGWLRVPPQPVDVFGLKFANPLGLAAGYDKDGLAWRGLAALGFGHIEIGTVTPEPQPGNPRPRVFRLPQQDALINRLGFPGRGAQFVARRLEQPRPAGLILGVNLGKNKNTPLEHAVEDYLALLRVFAPLSDYLVVNVSSPNTVGLRRLQARQALHDLLSRLDHERSRLHDRLGRRVPMLVKLSPDLANDELEDALGVILDNHMDGVIASNTTISRENVNSFHASEIGGLSGRPLRARSTAMVRKIYCLTNGSLPIVGVGGVMDAAHVKEKLDAGAVLVQIYTGLVYQGPGLVKRLLTDRTQISHIER